MLSTAPLVEARNSVPNALGMGTTDRRGKVTPEHLAEAQRLKKLYVAANHGLTQEAFGAAYGIGNQSAVWQFLNGRVALSMDAARGFSKGLHCDISAFSPRLAAEVAEIAEAAPARAKPTTALSFLDLKPDEVRLIGLFRELKPPQRVKLETIANEMHAAAVPKKSIANPFPDAHPEPSPAVARAIKAAKPTKKEQSSGSHENQRVPNKGNRRGAA